MATNRPLPSPLPADLPEDWQDGQIVAPEGPDVGLTEQHGYNYLMQQVNDAQRAVNALSGKSTLVTLSVSQWSNKSQTVAVQGISANEADQLITAVPAAANQSAYYDAGIKMTAQAANQITFTADTIPTVALSVYVVIQEVV